ncbi:MAG TPA: DUF29 domain-containing protein [Stellaceae bacterium]|nr:DUF29 domain-containing protein [Stellaceae bacterium]
MSDVKTLHDEDFAAWSKQQADALRAAARTSSNQALDWANLAEEIEDLGASQKSALHSQLRRIVQHLLKLENSPTEEPHRGWIESITDARVEIEYLLEVSPSLRAGLEAGIAAETKRAIRVVVRDLESYGEIDRVAAARLRATIYTDEQILDDWFPAEPRS